MFRSSIFLLFALSVVGAEINGSLTIAQITTPSAPATALSTLYVNSTTGVIGCLNAASTNCFNVNMSAAAPPTLPATTNFYAIGAAASSSRILGIAYAGTAFMTNARFDGTPVSPTAVQSGEQIGGYNAFGYDGTSLGGPLASIRIFANQNFTSSAHGTYVDITTTPNGTTTAIQVMQFNADGGITVPSTVTGGDKGVGTINAGGLFVNGVAVSTSTGLTINSTSISGSSANALLYVDGSGILQNAVNVTRTAAGTLTFGTSIISPLHTSAAALTIQPGADSTTGVLIKEFAGPTLVGFDTTNGRVTLGPSCSTGSNTLFIENCTATTGSTSVVIQGGAGNATSDILLNIKNAGGTSEFSVTDAGVVTLTGNIVTSSGNAIGPPGDGSIVINNSNQSSPNRVTVTMGNGTWSQSSGTQTVLRLSPTYNETSTAGEITLLINQTETGLGSGTHLMISAQVAGAAKFSVDHNGLVTLGAAGAFQGEHNATDGTAGVTVTTCTGFKNGLCISGT